MNQLKEELEKAAQDAKREVCQKKLKKMNLPEVIMKLWETLEKYDQGEFKATTEWGDNTGGIQTIHHLSPAQVCIKAIREIIS